PEIQDPIVPEFNGINRANPAISGQLQFAKEIRSMAALNIAFEVPARDWGASPSRSRPLDLVHLAVQTMGDKDLEAEVLQVFSRQARLALQEMGSADKAGMVAIAHRLKGA